MSKLILFDFVCEDCDNTTEDLVDPKVNVIKCPVCSGQSKRLPSAGKIAYRLMGVDPSFPTAGDKWGRMQEQKARAEKRENSR